MPLRSSTAGVSSAPAATTTVGARTVTRAVRPSPSTYVPSTPAARPSSTRTRSTRQFTTKRAPASAASCSHVFCVEFFAPLTSPKPIRPARSASYRSSFALRVMRWKPWPRASHAAFSVSVVGFQSEQRSVTLMRSLTVSRIRSNSGPARPSSPKSFSHSSRTHG